MKTFYQNLKNKAAPIFVWSAISMTAILTGCGGGGDGGGSGLTLKDLQGRWETANGDLVARWLPPSTAGQTTGSFWLLSSNTPFLTVLDTSVNGSQGVVAKGARYRLDPTSTQGVALEYIDWTGVANVNATPKTMSFVNGPALNLQDSLGLPALQGNAVGDWRSNLNLTALNLNVGPGGLITGDTNGGCEYDGVLTARSDVNMYEATLEEKCTDLLQVSVVRFTGIGFVSASVDKLTLALVSTDRTIGKVLYFTKQ